MINIRNHGGELQNLILEGPPGCGKTMVAKAITDATGFSYIRMSGAELTGFIDKNRHVSEFNEVMNRAERHHPCFIFIDECDTMLGNRDRLNHAHTELQNAFLARTGDPSKKVAIIVATNRISELDPAVVSRMDHQIHIGTPDYIGRIRILTQYIDHAFGGAEERTTVLNDDGIAAIASKTNHLAGRPLQKLVNTLKCAKYASNNNRLTQAIIDEAVYDYVWKDRNMPGAERSWRIIEMAGDLRHFTIPYVRKCFTEAIQYLYTTCMLVVRTLGEWTWEAVKPTKNLVVSGAVHMAGRPLWRSSTAA